MLFGGLSGHYKRRGVLTRALARMRFVQRIYFCGWVGGLSGRGGGSSVTVAEDGNVTGGGGGEGSDNGLHGGRGGGSSVTVAEDGNVTGGGGGEGSDNGLHGGWGFVLCLCISRRGEREWLHGANTVVRYG